MPKYIYKVQTDRVLLPTNGEVRFGNAVLNNASLTTIGTVSGKLTATKAATVAAVSTADATDLATALVLVNALKAKLNEVIAGQKTAAQML